MGRRVEALAVGSLVVGIAAFLLGPPPSRVTRENFDRIREGMSRAEVEGILGPRGVYANGPVFLPALKQCVLAGEPTDATWAWYTDDATVRIDFDESGGVVETRFGPTSRIKQGPLDNLLWRAENLLWRAERQLRRWFP